MLPGFKKRTPNGSPIKEVQQGVFEVQERSHPLLTGLAPGRDVMFSA